MWPEEDKISINEVKLISYSVVMSTYLRYILLRSTKFTNDINQIQYIAVYTLVTVCILTEKLEKISQLGLFIDSMIDSIGMDIKHKEVLVEKQSPTKLSKFLKDRAILDLAKGLNMLDGFTRQVLFLNHVEMMSTKEIGFFYEKPVCQIRQNIIAGEKRLKRTLRKIQPVNLGLLHQDVCLLLCDLDEVLGDNLSAKIAKTTLNYLAKNADEMLSTCEFELRSMFWSWKLN